MFARTAAQHLRAPALRRQLHGAADNAFNRERAAVKNHAAESSGELPSLLFLLSLYPLFFYSIMTFSVLCYVQQALRQSNEE